MEEGLLGELLFSFCSFCFFFLFLFFFFFLDLAAEVGDCFFLSRWMGLSIGWLTRPPPPPKTKTPPREERRHLYINIPPTIMATPKKKPTNVAIVFCQLCGVGGVD